MTYSIKLIYDMSGLKLSENNLVYYKKYNSYFIYFD